MSSAPDLKHGLAPIGPYVADDTAAGTSVVSDAAAGDEWSAAVDRSDAVSTEKVALSQDDIDSLFDVRLAGGDESRKKGIQSIINSATVLYERLPMLEVVFDRFVRLLTTSLRNFTSDTVEVSLLSMNSIRFGDYINSIPLPALLALFHAVELKSFGLMTVDSNLIYAVVDRLLGGRRGTIAMTVDGRPYSTIERNMVESMVEVVLSDFGAAFAPLKPLKFELDRMEANPRFATIARPTNVAVRARLKVDIEDRGGHIDVVIPHATLEPLRNMLMQSFMGEKFGQDSIWEEHLAGELYRARVDLQAVLEELTMPLSEVMNLKVGETLLLNVGPDAPIKLRCGGVDLMTGRMGRVGNRIAINIDSTLRRRRVRAHTVE